MHMYVTITYTVLYLPLQINPYCIEQDGELLQEPRVSEHWVILVFDSEQDRL